MDGCLQSQIHVGSGWKSFENVDVDPSYSLSSGEGVMSRGRPYFVGVLGVEVGVTVSGFPEDGGGLVRVYVNVEEG